MGRILGPDERKESRKMAARQVRLVILFFVIALGGGIIYLSTVEHDDDRIRSEKKPSFNYRYEFRHLKNEMKVDLYIDGSLFTSYLYNPDLKKHVLFPIITESGKKVTRGYPLEPRPFEPTDHPHHIGISLTHGVVNSLDFWSNTDSIPTERQFHYGTVLHDSFKKIKSGDKKGILEITALWERSDKRVLMDEKTIFTFTSEPGIRIIDRVTTLTARDLSVHFQDSKEGMYCMRVAREMEQPSPEHREYLDENLKLVRFPKDSLTGPKGLYENSEGLTGDKVWGKRAKWVSLKSVLEGETVSVIMFDHPANPNFPAHWMARGYGLFGINPFGSQVYSEGKESLNYFLEPGKSVTFNYRLAVINGIKPDKIRIEKLFDDFVSHYK